MNQKQFSKFVSKTRKITGLSQQKFGAAIGRSWITIWRWEKGINLPDEQMIDFWKDKINDSF